MSKKKKKAGEVATRNEECKSLVQENGICIDFELFSIPFGQNCSQAVKDIGALECDIGYYCNDTSVCDEVPVGDCPGDTDSHFDICQIDGGLYGECLCNRVGGTHQCYEVGKKNCESETRAMYIDILNARKLCQQQVPLSNDINCTNADYNSDWMGTCIHNKVVCSSANFEACIRNNIEELFYQKIEDTTLCNNKLPITSSTYICNSANAASRKQKVGPNAIASAITIPITIIIIIIIFFYFSSIAKKYINDILNYDSNILLRLTTILSYIVTGLLLTSLISKQWATGSYNNGSISHGLFMICIENYKCSSATGSLSLNNSTRTLLYMSQTFTILSFIISFISSIIFTILTLKKLIYLNNIIQIV